MPEPCQRATLDWNRRSLSRGQASRLAAIGALTICADCATCADSERVGGRVREGAATRQPERRILASSPLLSRDQEHPLPPAFCSRADHPFARSSGRPRCGRGATYGHAAAAPPARAELLVARRTIRGALFWGPGQATSLEDSRSRLSLLCTICLVRTYGVHLDRCLRPRPSAYISVSRRAMTSSFVAPPLRPTSRCRSSLSRAGASGPSGCWQTGLVSCCRPLSGERSRRRSIALLGRSQLSSSCFVVRVLSSGALRRSRASQS
jgi:hypothetical protein